MNSSTFIHYNEKCVFFVFVLKNKSHAMHAHMNFVHSCDV